MLSCILALVAAAVTPSPAAACSFGPPSDHVIVADPTDTTAPSGLRVDVEGIERGSSGGCSGGSSCDDIGSIELSLTSSDDVSAVENIGYEITVVDGALPDFATPHPRPVRLELGDRYFIRWSEQEAESFRAALSVVAIDEAGNRSTPVVFEVEDGGSGCHVSRAGRAALGLGPLALALTALLALRWRR